MMDGVWMSKRPRGRGCEGKGMPMGGALGYLCMAGWGSDGAACYIGDEEGACLDGSRLVKSGIGIVFQINVEDWSGSDL